MADFIQPGDLAPFATIAEPKAVAMIEDAEAMAKEAAPCIAEDDFAKQAAVKAILRAAILRWNETGGGAKTSRSGLGYSETIDTTNPRKGLFWPSEIKQLQDLCASASAGKAFSIDTMSSEMVTHAETCSLVFAATYCDCGADIAGCALYE